MKDNLTSKDTFSNRLNAQDKMGCRLSMKSSLQSESVASPAQLAAKSSNKAVNNTGLPDNIKSGVEALSGYSMDDVKVHYNSSKPAQLNAHAYAQGTDIHVASGQEQYLAHEAWHVVQQKQGRVQPTRQMKDKISVNEDEGLEHEADILGNKVVQSKCANGDCEVCDDCKKKKKNQNHQGVGTNVVQKVSMCRGTNRIGNLAYPGTSEHILIQQHYLMNINPMAEVEYLIPESGPNGGTGYADIVDPAGGIYEIKFHPFVASAISEVARYVAMAYTHCDEDTMWHAGLIYPNAVLPYMGDQELVTYLHAPGVIGYYLRRRQREPEREPVTEPQSVTDQIKKFVRQVLEEGMDAEQAAKEWLRGNPEVAWAIIGLGIAGIIALIADDLSGVGVADDVAIPPILTLIRVAATVVL